MAENPIKYSDLVKPDDSILQLIEQLAELNETYTATQENIKKEAISVRAELQKTTGAYQQGREEIKKQSAEADRLAKAEEKLNFARSETNRKLKEIEAKTREANQQAKLEEQLNNSLEGSYKRLSAQYALNRIELNKMSAEKRKNSTEGQKLVKETKDLYEKMKRLNEETGQYQLNVGNYTDSILKALKINNDFGRTLIGLGKGGEEAKGAFTAISDGAAALGKSLLGLMTNPVFLAIAGIAGVGAGFKMWYDYNAGLQEATRLTKQFTGTTGDELKAVRSEIIAVAEVYGKDFKEILQAADVVASNFGITTKEALDDIRKGFAAGADANGDFLDKLKQAPELIKAGVENADQLVSILSQSKSGLLADPETLKQAIQMRSEAEGIALAFERLNNPALLDQLREATHGTVSDLDLMKAAIKFENFKLPLQDLGTYLAFAQQKAKDTGESVDYLVTSIVNGLGRKSKMILDNLGISAAEIDKKMAKSGDMTQAVAEIIREEMAKTGTYVETASDKASKATAERQNKILQLTKTMDDSLDSVLEREGKIGELQDELVRSEEEYQNALAALFDATGGDFETMTTKGKIFLKDVMTKLLKAVMDVYNWFVRIYNQSIGFQAIVKTGLTPLIVGLISIKNALSVLYSQLKGIGSMLEGVFTLNWDKFKKGITDYATAPIEGAMNAVSDFKKAMNALNNFKPKEIKIPVTTDKGGMFVPSESSSGGKDKANNDGSGNGDNNGSGGGNDNGGGKTKSTKSTKDKAAEAEKAYQANLQARRKYEDAQTDIMEDGFEKRIRKTELQYSRQAEDLRHKLATDLTLSKQAHEDITNTIEAIEKKKDAEILRIKREQQIEELQLEKETIDLRLKAVAEGSEEELQLRMDAINKEQQIALLKNLQKPEEQQQTTLDVVAQFDKPKADLADKYVQSQMAIFDAQQDLAQSEFDLLSNSEYRKTRFRLQAEKERLQKILEMNKIAGTKLSEAETQTIQNTIAKIDKEAEQSKGKRDLWDIMGFNLSDEEKETLNENIDFATEAMNSYMDAYVAAADAKVEAANKEVDAAKKALDTQLEARANGYANDVETAQKELELQKQNQEKALNQQKKAQRAQMALQTIQQIGDLVTATAKIWATFGNPLIAIPMTALMWGSFAMSKIKAAQMAKKSESYGEGTLELLQGGSHQSGNDIDFGTKPDGTRRRAEGGEYFAVINKRNSRRFRNIIPSVINSLNDGTFPNKYLDTFSSNVPAIININNDKDLAGLKDDVRTIKEQNERRIFMKGNGDMVEIYKNVTRTIKH